MVGESVPAGGAARCRHRIAVPRLPFRPLSNASHDTQAAQLAAAGATAAAHPAQQCNPRNPQSKPVQLGARFGGPVQPSAPGRSAGGGRGCPPPGPWPTARCPCAPRCTGPAPAPPRKAHPPQPHARTGVHPSKPIGALGTQRSHSLDLTKMPADTRATRDDDVKFLRSQD